MRRHLQRWHVVIASIAWCITASPVAAITVRIDYTYDNAANKFFSTGNAQGPQAKAALDSAAAFFSNILNDSFSPITVPAKFNSTESNGMVTWEWTRTFSNPANANLVTLTHNTAGQTIAPNEYVVFAGARNLAGNTLGIGGAGGCGLAPNIPCWKNNPTGTFSSSEISDIQTITNDFKNQVERRDQSSGFANWGGTISFDSVPPVPWHYNHNTLPSGSVADFYSVAIHELAHALGFGGSTEWQSWVSGTSPPRFYGANANGLYGGSVPLELDGAHWASGTTSVAYGTSVAQETAMDPTLTNGTRKLFTELDAAAMKDIGWTIIPLPGVNGDYNNNGVVDAADYVVWRRHLGQSVTIPNDSTAGMVSSTDYTVWRTNFGKSALGGSGASQNGSAVPEPGSAALLLMAVVGIYLAHRKRCR